MQSERLIPEKLPGCVRVVHVGDVVGKPGMAIVCSMIDSFRQQDCDAIIVNAENAAEGAGLTVKAVRAIVRRRCRCNHAR